ncbi:MAG TPA: putative Ig domain-containing protein [Solirubrobacteraceae bacterium]|nr:putative Ig domain-containing protein [Solirubrobacteraceae bacterium]
MPRWTVGTGGSMAVGLQARRRQSLLGVLLLGVALVGLGTWSSFARADGGPGSVLAWGYNGYGELGNGTITSSNVPVAVSAGAIPPGTTITQIAAGRDHSLALSSSGQLYAWGDNEDGELGNGTETASSVPVAVSAPPGTTFVQIAAEDDGSLALSSTGQVYAWGYNGQGELGDGSTTNSDTPVAVSAGAIPGGTTITQIAGGGSHSLALSSTGQLYTWGLNEYGQLGDSTITNSSVPVAVSAGAIPAGATITQIAAGALHSLALSSTGQLYTWGLNVYGQLGDGTTTNSDVPVAVSAGAIPAGATITQIAGGEYHSLALSSTGQLYAWGKNANGELGDGTNSNSSVPVATSLPAGTTIDALARGSFAEHALAIIGDLSITTSALAAATVGSPYTTPLAGTGGMQPYTWSAAGLAPGLSLNPSSGAISGTPTLSGSYSVAVTLTDSDGLRTSKALTLNVAAATGVPGTPMGTPVGTSPFPVVTTPGIASTPKAVEELLLGCSSSALVLNDVYIQGAHVAIRGSAAKSLVGKKVKILFNEGKQVATATVGANGQYSTTAPLPPAKIRDSLSTRYTAEVGKLRSLHLKLVRRLLLEPPKASPTTVTLTGQVTLPLTKPVAPVLVEEQLECGKTTIAKTFTPPSNGRFNITLTVPSNAKAGIFRLKSKVAANKHSTKHGFTTFSLPLPVALG